MVKTKRKHKRKKKKVVIPPVEPIEVKLPDGLVTEIRGDGRVWYKPVAFGAGACVPIPHARLLRGLRGVEEPEKVEPKLLQEPDVEWRVPPEVLKEWGLRLGAFSTEALCVYGRLNGEPTEGKPLWMAVVPKQEVGMASVDVDDFGPAVQTLVKKGYTRVGTIHTHPGGGSSYSRGGKETDDVLYAAFGGIHIILSKIGTGDVYYSIGGETWHLTKKEDSEWVIPRLWGNEDKKEKKGCPTLVSQTGGKKIAKMLKEKVIWVSQGTQFGFGNQQGYQRTGYMGAPIKAPVGTTGTGEIRTITVGGVLYSYNLKTGVMVKSIAPTEGTEQETQQRGRHSPPPKIMTREEYERSEPTGDALPMLEMCRGLLKCKLPPRAERQALTIMARFCELWKRFDAWEDSITVIKKYAWREVEEVADELELRTCLLGSDLVGDEVYGMAIKEIQALIHTRRAVLE